jgi:hypothetical protein
MKLAALAMEQETINVMDAQMASSSRMVSVSIVVL